MTTSVRQTVLVVDDNLDMLETSIHVFHMLGYNVITASNAADALKMVEDGTIVDIIFTDVVMPGTLRSIEMVEQIKEKFPNIKVIFCTGYGDTSKILLGESATVLEKPYSIDDLSKILSETKGVESA